MTLSGLALALLGALAAFSFWSRRLNRFPPRRRGAAPQGATASLPLR